VIVPNKTKNEMVFLSDFVRFLVSDSVTTITQDDLRELARAVLDSDEFIFASGDPKYCIELSPEIVSHLLNAFDIAISKFQNKGHQDRRNRRGEGMKKEEEKNEKSWLRVALRWAHSIASVDNHHSDKTSSTRKPIPAGIGSGLVPDANMTSSSIYGLSCRACYARLHLQGVEGWCPDKKKKFSEKEFLEIDLGRHRIVVGIQTMGSGKYAEWTETYYVYTSVDGKDWERRSALKNDGKSYTKTFKGNNDRRHVVEQRLYDPARARYVRIVPKSWHKEPCIRVEVLLRPSATLAKRCVFWSRTCLYSECEARDNCSLSLSLSLSMLERKAREHHSLYFIHTHTHKHTRSSCRFALSISLSLTHSLTHTQNRYIKTYGRRRYRY